MKKMAFTLAEVLIALSIVGVVAVLTIPALLGNIYSKANVSTLKSTYKQFGDAISKAMVDQGVVSIADLEFSGDSNNDQLLSFVTKYLNVANNCGENPGNCFASSYSYYGGANVSDPFSMNSIFSPSIYLTLTNGASIAIRLHLKSQDAHNAYLFIDVNGAQKPNVIGKDYFAVLINEDGSLGFKDGISVNSIDNYKELCRESQSSLSSCFELLKARNWEIDSYMN